MMFQIKLIILIAFLFVPCIGCGEKSTSPSVITPKKRPPPIPQGNLSLQPKVEQPPYQYMGAKFKDPFIPLDVKGVKKMVSSEENTGELDPASLVLKGILIDDTDMMATLADLSGNSYIIKNKRLYNTKNELIEGVVGIVKLESVVIITKDKTVRELKLIPDDEFQ